MEPAAPKRSKSWGRKRIALILFATIVCPMTLMGCLSMNFGSSSQKSEDPSVVAQTGSVPIAKGQEAVVYYPKAYSSPPNLELDDPNHKYQVIEQRADCFRVRNESGSGDLKWTARGVPVPAQPAVVVVPATPATTATLTERVVNR